jgi:hypothetical protein
LQPKNIILQLNKSHPGHSIVPANIYPIKRQANCQASKISSPILELKKSLATSQFTLEENLTASGELKTLFFFHPSSLQLLSQ